MLQQQPPPYVGNPVGWREEITPPSLSSSASSSTLSSQQPQGRLPWDHGVNVFKSFIGSNYLSIPFCFAASGLLLGPVAIFLIAAISGWGCMLLIKVRRRLEDEKHIVDTYGQVRKKQIVFTKVFRDSCGWGGQDGVLGVDGPPQAYTSLPSSGGLGGIRSVGQAIGRVFPGLYTVWLLCGLYDLQRGVNFTAFPGQVISDRSSPYINPDLLGLVLCQRPEKVCSFEFCIQFGECYLSALATIHHL